MLLRLYNPDLNRVKPAGIVILAFIGLSQYINGLHKKSYRIYGKIFIYLIS